MALKMSDIVEKSGQQEGAAKQCNAFKFSERFY